jgi:hypothetical protein
MRVRRYGGEGEERRTIVMLITLSVMDLMLVADTRPASFCSTLEHSDIRGRVARRKTSGARLALVLLALDLASPVLPASRRRSA